MTILASTSSELPALAENLGSAAIWIASLPDVARIALLFCVGVIAGSLANWAIYRLAWHSRAISPWSKPTLQVPPRKIWDRIPIVGWFGLSRESSVHGKAFWIRPMILEILVGVTFVGLYQIQVGQLAEPCQANPEAFLAGAYNKTALIVCSLRCAILLILSLFMLVAAMIDADETYIPDSVTIPGTLLGLLIAALLPIGLLPEFSEHLNDARTFSSSGYCHNGMTLATPLVFEATRAVGKLAIGLGCWWLWCIALMPRTWYPRHGICRAFGLSCARMRREKATYLLLAMAIVGSAPIAAVWWWSGYPWMMLLTSLVGLAVGGGIIYAVRVIGTLALKKEAMGFGDVTLMAMIGAFVGWQATLVVFFLAPVAGLVLGLLQVIFRRGNVLPYGPFLCLATLATVLLWVPIWDHIWHVFAIGRLVPVMLIVSLLLMGILLLIWRTIREAVGF